MLGGLRKIPDDRLLVGLETSDDAAVYEVAPGTLVIQTLDYFPPIVDDAYDFGAIAATNALSDVWAMGGRPVTALNIFSFPSCLPMALAKEILRAGNDKALEAGCNIVGGHSIDDKVPKYGLSVNGVCKKEELLSNVGARPGDVLLLTKRLGVGIVSTAIRAHLASKQEEKACLDQMKRLNNFLACLRDKKPGSNFDLNEIHALTDVTGFGVAGHSLEMLSDPSLGLVLDTRRFLTLPGTQAYAQDGFIPASLYHNREYLQEKIDSEVKELWREDLCYDPQTSGGLLIACTPSFAPYLLAEAQDQRLAMTQVGTFVERDPKGDTKPLKLI